MNPVKQRYLDAAAASDSVAVTTVEVWTGPTATVVPSKISTLGTTTAGTWSEDETRSPRRQSSLTVESQGLSYDQLVPTKIGDLLHPLTGNELRIFSGYRYPDGTTELAPGGVYRMTKPKVVDTGDKIEISITGNDRAFEVDRRRWTAPYPITTSPTLSAAIHDAMDSRMPGLVYNLAPTTMTVPSITLGTQGASSTPMADLIAMATAGGMELFFDADGVVIMRPVPDPTTSLVVMNFAEGKNCTLTEIDRTLDETMAYNGVIATSSAAGVAVPVQAAVWVTDPNSPLNPAVFGYVPYFYDSPFLTTTAQCTSAATAILQTLLTAYDDTAFTAAQNAALTCGDCLGLVRSRIGISGNYVASAIAMSATPGAPMTVTNRARRSA